MSDASDPVENDSEFQLQPCGRCGHTRRAHHPGAYHNADQAAIHRACRPPCRCSVFAEVPGEDVGGYMAHLAGAIGATPRFTDHSTPDRCGCGARAGSSHSSAQAGPGGEAGPVTNFQR